MGVETTFVEQEHFYLGRQRVHDSESRRFAAPMAAIDRSKWKTKSIRIYDPPKNPNQCHGECTGCAKAMQLNAVGNRVGGVVLDMDDAHTFYHWATTYDPFDGVWPPADTGSSGLASCKAAQRVKMGGVYQHVFNGADGVVQLIQEGHVVSVGTWWYAGMDKPNAQRVIEPTGRMLGGHQYVARGYSVKSDLVTLRCWWGDYRDVFIRREYLHELLMDGGDAHIQKRLVT